MDDTSGPPPIAPTAEPARRPSGRNTQWLREAILILRRRRSIRRRAVSAKLIWAVMSELAGNEDALVRLYRKHLPLLERAAGTQ
jgi:hypothetical protein